MSLDINLHELTEKEKEAWGKFCAITGYHMLFSVIQAHVQVGVKHAVEFYKDIYQSMNLESIEKEGFWTKNRISTHFGFLSADACKIADIVCLTHTPEKVIIFEIKGKLLSGESKKEKSDDIHKAFGQIMFYRSTVSEDYQISKENVGGAIICQKFDEPLYIPTLKNNLIDVFELETEQWIVKAHER